jgi:hypothetical protein
MLQVSENDFADQHNSSVWEAPEKELFLKAATSSSSVKEITKSANFTLDWVLRSAIASGAIRNF